MSVIYIYSVRRCQSRGREDGGDGQPWQDGYGVGAIRIISDGCENGFDGS